MVRSSNRRTSPSTLTQEVPTEAKPKKIAYGRVSPIRPSLPRPQQRGRGRPRVRRIETPVLPRDLQISRQPVVRLEDIRSNRTGPLFVDLTEENLLFPSPPRPPAFEPQPGPSTTPDEPRPSTSRTALNLQTSSEPLPGPSTSIVRPKPSVLAKPVPFTSSSYAPHPNARSIRLSADPDILSREERYVREIYIRAHRGGFNECRKPCCLKLKETTPSPVLGRPAFLTKKKKE